MSDETGERSVRGIVSPLEGRMKALIKKFVRDEEGQDLIEYGLLIGIITAGAVTFIAPIGGKVSSYFSSLNGALP